MKVTEIVNLVIGILLIVPGALMVADGVLVMLGNDPTFFDVSDKMFEFIMGFALIILGASQLDAKDND